VSFLNKTILSLALALAASGCREEDPTIYPVTEGSYIVAKGMVIQPDVNSATSCDHLMFGTILGQVYGEKIYLAIRPSDGNENMTVQVANDAAVEDLNEKVFCGGKLSIGASSSGLDYTFYMAVENETYKKVRLKNPTFGRSAKTGKKVTIPAGSVVYIRPYLLKSI
jgi:hypothetical protein